MAFVFVFNDHHLKHARQAQKGRRRQENQRSPAAAIDLPMPQFRGINPRQRLANAAANSPDDKGPDGHQGKKLDHRLNRDGHDNPVVAFVGIQIAGAKQNGKKGQSRGHPKRG